MQANVFFSSSSSASAVLHHQVSAVIRSLLPARRKKQPFIIAMAASSRGSDSKGRDYGGRMVDESMIVLRMRIREMKLSDKSHEQLPSHWMEWEKEYYVDYNQDVCEAMGLLQNYLMNLRPSFTLGVIALSTLAVLLCSGMALIHAAEIVQMILSGFHLN